MTNRRFVRCPNPNNEAEGQADSLMVDANSIVALIPATTTKMDTQEVFQATACMMDNGQTVYIGLELHDAAQLLGVVRH